MQWELDVVGPLPRAQPQFWFLLVATDYIKWIEIVPLKSHWTASGQISVVEYGMSLWPTAHYHL